MAGPYDYSINIPQPPAQNFLQSLMGIRQLQQMEDQSAIQQQQAAIQQQQAGFAREKQPLELAAMRAAEKSALASAASSQSVTAAKDYELTQQKALDTELLGISSDPSKFTADNIEKLAIRFHRQDPTLLVRSAEMRKNMPNQAKIFGDNTAKDLIITSVTGDSEAAIKQLDKRLEAANNTPELKSFVPQLEQLKQSFIDNPDQTIALATVGQTFFAPDQGKAITDVLSEQAKIKEAQAKTKKELAAARVEEAKLTPGGKEMSADQQKDINTLTDASSQLRNTTSAFDEQLNLILNFAEQNPKEFKTGALASIENWASGKQGVAQQAKNLRSNFQRFATEDWIKRAEPLKGGLNKEEGERLERGVPNIMTATPSELLNFGRLVSKINLLEADQKELNAAWQQNARSLQAKAPAEFEAAGITVRAGERWSEAQTRLRDSYKKKNEAQLQEDLLRLKRIEQAGKSGTSPIPNMYNLGGAPQQQQQPAYVPPSGVIIKSRK